MAKQKAPADADTPMNFEAALAELETLVARMEDGDLSLEESLQAFERGVALTRKCQTALAEAELKVQKLTEDNELEDVAFDSDADPDALDDPDFDDPDFDDVDD